jgi:hypothetical protein
VLVVMHAPMFSRHRVSSLSGLKQTSNARNASAAANPGGAPALVPRRAVIGPYVGQLNKTNLPRFVGGCHRRTQVAPDAL